MGEVTLNEGTQASKQRNVQVASCGDDFSVKILNAMREAIEREIKESAARRLIADRWNRTFVLS